jgi:hypothetical protein
MAEAFKVNIKATGPMFDQATIAKFQPIINRGLLDLAIFEGANNVKEQLYPGHGRLTGNLRNHVWASLRGDSQARVDAGSSMRGRNIEYAAKVEGLYGMFENTTRRLEQNAERFGDKYIGDPIIELLGGQP